MNTLTKYQKDYLRKEKIYTLLKKREISQDEAARQIYKIDRGQTFLERLREAVRYVFSSKDDVAEAVVVVTLKPTVLDPQGVTIQRSIATNGFSEVADVRQGKYFEIRFATPVSNTEAFAILERLGKEVLANPVIEQHRVVLD